MNKPKRKRSNKLLFLLTGLVVVLLVFALIGKKQGWIGKAKEIEVELGDVAKVRIVEQVSASGMVQPVYEVKISPDVPGEIIELNVEEGDSVQKGQLLLKIRPDIYQTGVERARANLNQQLANLSEARARVARAEAQLIRSEAEFKRSQQLLQDKVVAQSDYELSEANYKVAVNDLESARQSVRAAEYIVASAGATVREAEENLRYTIITAPVTGIVTKRSVELGERVVGTAQMAGTEMLRIADLSQMEARVDVNENDIIRVSIGDTAVIDIDSYAHTGKKFKGLVTLIANTANTKTSPDAVTEFEVRILLLSKSYQDLLAEKPDAAPFRPGMTASVDITTEIKDNVLSVPLAAVTTRKPGEDEDNKGDGENGNSGQDDEQQVEDSSRPRPKEAEPQEVVFLAVDGKAVMVPVKTGISDFDHIEITEGLEEGQKVVKGPFIVVSKRLKDGDGLKEKVEKEPKKEEK
jgi:HlyD family secretion protein